MKYYYKIHQWENGAKGKEWTQYCLAPIFIEDKLDETLDTALFTLDAVPIAYKEPFAPKTKWVIERYLTDPDGAEPAPTPQKYWHFVTDHDDVETHIGCPTICTHRVHLIECSVVCQGMLVDNIALTYELQDVTLNYRTVTENTDKIGNGVVATPGGYQTGA